MDLILVTFYPADIQPNNWAIALNWLLFQMDIDGNGMIDMEEFCLCMARHIAVSRQRAQQSQAQSNRPRLSTQQLRDAFNFFDKVLVII